MCDVNVGNLTVKLLESAKDQNFSSQFPDFMQLSKYREVKRAGEVIKARERNQSFFSNAACEKHTMSRPLIRQFSDQTMSAACARRHDARSAVKLQAVAAVVRGSIGAVLAHWFGLDQRRRAATENRHRHIWISRKLADEVLLQAK